jgi:protein phosphatase
MPHPAEPRIQCSNPNCVASNELEALFCHRCKTPVIKRYLWATKEIISQEQEKELINNRYLVISSRIFLDTQPGNPPQTPEEVSKEIIPYLQLFPCYPNIPQVYGQLDGTNAWLLDYGTVPTQAQGELIYPEQLIPELRYLWQNATALQQLNWLWQIIQLWQPLFNKKVASTLLNPELIRVNGQVVQTIQLQSDSIPQPSLRNLGDLWSQWAENASPNIQDLLEDLSARLETGIIEQVDQVIAVLDKAIDKCRRSQEYSYQVYAVSDSGPSRKNNEDAAYPTHSTTTDIPATESSLTIVCDGVGGHDGGEIASKETINYLQSRISELSIGNKDHNPKQVLRKLTKYINESNDIINKRNDSEQRQERQRMGTTLVMTLSHAQEIYIAHVGDSRIYWITPTSCHQVTVDDDLASREVRLGYAVYRDSLQYPSAGALIQALGMRDSAALHPNLQRHIIDDDCIFLLCTDGLSDFDRVEQYWKHIVSPVLKGEKDLASAVKDLVNIANQKNGHDNVTVALVHCQVKHQASIPEIIVSWSDVESAVSDAAWWPANSNRENPAFSDTGLSNPPPPETDIPEQSVVETLPTKSQPTWLKSLILVLIVSTTVGIILSIFLQDKIKKPDNSPPIPLDIPESEVIPQDE